MQKYHFKLAKPVSSISSGFLIDNEIFRTPVLQKRGEKQKSLRI